VRDLVGRVQERAELEDAFHSGRPEFMAVYGRRRVGKTFLVRSVLERDFAFFFTAAPNATRAAQLASFAEALAAYGGGEPPVLASWPDAFRALRRLLDLANRKRKVVFIDELPWLDTHKSGFVPALDWFWNSWASTRPDILLIVCGSAANWMIHKLFGDRGGLHNRVTYRMRLEPFTLLGCEQFYAANGIVMNRYQMVESYMIFGGIPYYLSLMRKDLGMAQNVDRLCFREGGPLRDEYELLYRSLFQNAEGHMAVVEALAKKAAGLTREEILKKSGMSDGGGFSKTLLELEQSGFLRKYTGYGKKKKDAVYQLIDFFTLFHLRFIRNNEAVAPFWTEMADHGSHRAWTGYAFEQVALAHVEQIKRKLQIGGVLTRQYSWRSCKSKPGVQIDLVIDRNDGVINLCEMKYAAHPYTVDKAEAEMLQRKREQFRAETKVKSALHITFVTSYGLSEKGYCSVAEAEITMDDLF